MKLYSLSSYVDRDPLGIQSIAQQRIAPDTQAKINALRRSGFDFYREINSTYGGSKAEVQTLADRLGISLAEAAAVALDLFITEGMPPGFTKYGPLALASLMETGQEFHPGLLEGQTVLRRGNG